MRVVPEELALLHQLFVVEESLSVIRHDLRNKMGSVRNAAFYIRRKLDKIAPEVAAKDPRIPDFLGLIVGELDAAEGILQSRLPAPDQPQPITVAAIIDRVRALAALPADIRLEGEPAPSLVVRAALDEGSLALCCFIQNAVDAGARTIRIRVFERDGDAVFHVDDDGAGFAEGAEARALEPFFSTRVGRMGVGLNIARRIANRWKGKIELVSLERGVRACLELKVNQ
jgi:signal transduction histidine kinase